MEEDQNIPNCQTTGDKNTLPAGTLKISPEQNIESISPPDQHKRGTDSVIPQGWKLGKDACCGWVAMKPLPMGWMDLGNGRHLKFYMKIV